MNDRLFVKRGIDVGCWFCQLVLIEKIGELVIWLDLIALLFSGVYVGSGWRTKRMLFKGDGLACRHATSL
jgi:hypothetical protein